MVSTEQQLKKTCVGEKSSKVLNTVDSGRSQDLPSKYNKPTTTKSSKDLEAQFAGAIKSSSINGTSGPSSLNEATIEQNQVSCYTLVMDRLSMVLISHKKAKIRDMDMIHILNVNKNAIWEVVCSPNYNKI